MTDIDSSPPEVPAAFTVQTSTERVATIRTGLTAMTVANTIVRIAGPGAAACLQGLLTSDVEHQAEYAAVYGAILTPKGMILVDLWTIRDPEGFLLIADHGVRTLLLDQLRRQLPPRLAKFTDLTDAWLALQVVGGAGSPIPLVPGPLAESQGGVVAHGPPATPFRSLIVGPAAEIERTRTALEQAGIAAGTPADLAIARVISGWPSLGREIGDKTLPQEVRYDELGGVSYTKGCYVGQETVARIHFRGHPNRTLRGLRFAEAPNLTDPTIRSNDKVVGTIGTAVVIDRAETLALAVIRREVATGDVVDVGGQRAVVVELPFSP